MPKPKDPWGTPIGRCVIRKEATRYSPLFRQEFEAAFQSYRRSLPPDQATLPYADLIVPFQLFPEGENLCQRWGLAFALHPDDKLWDVPPDSAPAFFKDPGCAVKVIPHEKTRLIPISDEESRLDLTSNLREDRYLRVDLDLSASKGQIVTETEDLVDKYQDLIIEKEAHRQSQNQEGPPFPPDDLTTEQWIAERNKQEKQRLAEIRVAVEKNMAYRRRSRSLDIYLTPAHPAAP
jgi:hypothetical protein